jgi:hypothetical protein
MSIALKKRPPEVVPTPSSQHVTLFVDMAGNPYLKDSNGVLTPATNLGNPIQLNDQPGAPAPVANAVKVYAKDVFGKAELFALNDSGEEAQLTADGSIAPGKRIVWKNDNPGELFDATQVPSTITTPVKAVISNPAFSLSGLYTINYGGSPATGSITLVNNDRVLRASTTNPVLNGIWVAHAGAWTRATDADSWVEIQDGLVDWPVDTLGGSPGEVLRWMLWNPTNTPITPGTNPQEWVMSTFAVAGFMTPNAKVVSTSNITLANAQTIDSVSVVNNDRVLVNGQTNPVHNGVYVVVGSGPWTRAGDASEGMQIVSNTIQIDNGTYATRVFTIRSGTTQPIVVGTDPQFWELLNQAGIADFGPIRIAANFNDIPMIRSGFVGPGSGYPIINLPPITPQNGGKVVSLRDFGPLAKGGTLSLGLCLFQPSGSDFVCGGNPGEYVGIITEACVNYDLESDGLSQWSLKSAIAILMPGGQLSGSPFILGPGYNATILGDTP